MPDAQPPSIAAAVSADRLVPSNAGAASLGSISSAAVTQQAGIWLGCRHQLSSGRSIGRSQLQSVDGSQFGPQTASARSLLCTRS